MAGFSGHGAGLFVIPDVATAIAETVATWTKVGNTRDISGPSLSTNDVDVTNNDSENHFKEYIAGLIDPGEVTFDIVLDPDERTHIGTSNSLLAWELDRLVRHWRLLLPIDGDLVMAKAGGSGLYTVASGIATTGSFDATKDTFIKFDGFVKGFDIATPMEEAIMASLTIRTTGNVEFV